MADNPIEEGSTGEIDGIPVIYKDGHWVRQERQSLPASRFERITQAIPTALRVGSAFLGTEGALPGAAFAGLGEAAAQTAELMTGQRRDYSVPQIGAASALGAIPFGRLTTIRGLKQAPTVVREGVELGRRAAGGGIVGGTGAAVTALADGASGTEAWEQAKAAAPMGAAFGVALPPLVGAAGKVFPAMSDLMQGKSQFLMRLAQKTRETVDPVQAALQKERLTAAQLDNERRRLANEFQSKVGPSRVAKAIADAKTAQSVADASEEMERGLAANQTLSAEQKQQVLESTRARADAKLAEIEARTNKLQAQTVAVQQGVLREDAKLPFQLQQYASELDAAKTVSDIRKAESQMRQALADSTITDRAQRRQMTEAIAADAKARMDALEQASQGMTPTQVTQGVRSGGRSISVTSRPVEGTLAAGEEVVLPVGGQAAIQPLENAIAEGYSTPFVRGGEGLIKGALDTELNNIFNELRLLSERMVLTPEQLRRQEMLIRRVDEIGRLRGQERNLLGKDPRALPK